MKMIEEKSEICFRRSFGIQLLGTGFVTVLKLVFGILGNSQAMLAGLRVGEIQALTFAHSSSEVTRGYTHRKGDRLEGITDNVILFPNQRPGIEPNLSVLTKS